MRSRPTGSSTIPHLTSRYPGSSWEYEELTNQYELEVPGEVFRRETIWQADQGAYGYSNGGEGTTEGPATTELRADEDFDRWYDTPRQRDNRE